MTDRTTKFLLAVIALLLIALLVRPSAFTLTAAQAQTGTPGFMAPAQMVVSGNTVYVLQAGELSAYRIDTEDSKRLVHDGSEPIALRRVASAAVR